MVGQHNLAGRLRLVRAVAAAGAVTAHGELLEITTEALSTAAAALYTLTITNGRVLNVSDFVDVPAIRNGTNSQGAPNVVSITNTVGQTVIVVRNDHASLALNGTLIIQVRVMNIQG
jgi:hypothetical protein